MKTWVVESKKKTLLKFLAWKNLKFKCTLLQSATAQDHRCLERNISACLQMLNTGKRRLRLDLEFKLVTRCCPPVVTAGAAPSHPLSLLV